MLVRCISNKTNLDDATYRFLAVGALSKVYGLILMPSGMEFFVCQPGENPFFIPSHFFEVIDHRLPPDWSVCLPRSDANFQPLFEHYQITALIGYKELVTSIAHYHGVLNRYRADMQLFFEVKGSIDLWQDRITEIDSYL